MLDQKILVLGIGNVIRGDDGIGIHVVRRLRSILPSDFEIKELATAGLDLMDAIAGFDKAILIDAVQTKDGEPGRVYHASLANFKSSINLSSTHAINLDQVIALGKKLLGKKMPQIEVLAIEAKMLYELYTSGDYDFYLVTLVKKNEIASNRLDNEYNLFGLPTVFIDGGYNVIMGGAHEKPVYAQAIREAESRDVPKIMIKVLAEYDNATNKLESTVFVKNMDDQSM